MWWVEWGWWVEWEWCEKGCGEGSNRWSGDMMGSGVRRDKGYLFEERWGEGSCEGSGEGSG